MDSDASELLPEAPQKGAGIEWLRAVWSRRKWLAIPVFIAPLTVGVSVALFMPNIYRATATVLVDRQQVPETLVAPTVTSALETRLQTISQEILSRSRLEALITRFGLYRDLKKRVAADEVIERMRGDIKLELKGVDVKGQSQATVAFTISYLGSVPDTVALVTNQLASFYIEENLKVRERQATSTAQFLRVQLEDTKKQLDEQERRVSAFKRQYLGELPQQMEANLSTLDRLQMQLRMNADAQTRAQERRTFLRAQLEQGGSAGGKAESPAARLAQLRQQLTELRTRYTEQYPDVVDAKAEIEAINRDLAERKAKGKADPEPTAGAGPYGPALAEAEADLKVLKNEEGRLRTAIAVYQQRIERIPQREQEFKDLSRDYETTREFYQSLLKRHDEAQIAESMEQRQKGEQFRIIEPAMAPTQPVASRLRLLLMSVVLSAGLAAVAVILAEQLDTSFHTIKELTDHTAARLLINIPRIVTEAEAHEHRMRLRLGAAVASAGVLVLIVVSYFVAHGNEQLVWLLARSRS